MHTTTTYSRRKRQRQSTANQQPSNNSEIQLSRKRTKTTVEILTDTEQDPTTPPAHAAQPATGPFTPKKPAKDLSSLFDFSPTPSPNGNEGSPKVGGGSGGGIAKRMLSRTRTESSSFDSSTTSVASLSFTFPPKDNSPARSPSPSKPLSTLAIPAPLPPALSLPPTQHHTRTYAGKSRSFLIALPTSNLPSLVSNNEDEPINEQDDIEARTESYTDLRTRWGVDNSEDDPPYPHPTEANNPSPNPSPSHSRSLSPTKQKQKTKQNRKSKSSSSKDPHPTNQHQPQPPAPAQSGLSSAPLKSITELRSKGETRRFLDDLGYLFEGMFASPSLSSHTTSTTSAFSSSDSNLNVRRATALEIVTKLCQHDFARKAKAADFYTRAWDVFVDAGAAPSSHSQAFDKILATILAFFTALLARDPTSLSELAQRQQPSDSDSEPPHADFVQTLITLLNTVADRDKDPLAIVTSNAMGDAELKRAGIGRTEKTLVSIFFLGDDALI